MGGGRTIPQTSDRAVSIAPDGAAVSVLKSLKHQITIGSTIDPTNGDQNPYGLAIAPSCSTDSATGKCNGFINKGELFVCNFNNSSNVQGTGTTIVTLAPKAGSSPQSFEQGSNLLGCASLAMTKAGPNTFTASFGAKVSEYSSSGALTKTISKNLVHPWSVAWAVSGGPYTYATTALFVSDASTGSIVESVYCNAGSCSYPNIPIVTGFAVNHGAPGSIFGPSGLTFSAGNCIKIGANKACGTLYVVDGQTNTVVAIHNVLNIHKAKSIVVGKSGKTFGGPLKTWANVVYAGSPLKGPISAALLFNGNLVVGNTTEPAGKNDLVEIAQPACTAVPCTHPGKVLDTVNVDTGAAGALFGIAATGTKASNTAVYFNDDNGNNVQALTP